MKSLSKNILLLLVFLCSCETVIDIDIPKDDPKLVLNSFFNPDSTVSVTLSESQHILDAKDIKTVQGANVFIYDEDGTEQAQLTDSGSGVYTSTFKPEAGKYYRIEAQKNGFESISGSDKIPSDSVRVSNIELKRISNTNDFDGGYFEYEIIFTVQDYTGNDFYEVLIYDKSVYEYDGEIYSFKNYEYLESEDQVFDEFSSGGSALIFNDVLFDGGLGRISVNTYLNFNEYCDEEPECISFDVFLTLRKVSEEYFKYKRTLGLQRELNGNPFAEPVSVYNNISNGFGVFAGFRGSDFLLEAPEN